MKFLIPYFFFVKDENWIDIQVSWLKCRFDIMLLQPGIMGRTGTATFGLGFDITIMGQMLAFVFRIM